MVLENIFLLKMPPFWAILIISFAITLLTTLVYKFTTDQKKMKKLKEDMKEYQKKIKALSKSDPQKAMSIQQEAMKQNMEYMKHSFKSTIYTFIPILIIFGWLNAHMGYYPLMPNQPFMVTAYFAEGHAEAVSISSIPELELLSNATQSIVNGKAEWELKGAEGEYKLEIDYNRVMESAAADKRIGRSHLEPLHKGYRGYGGKCLPKDIRALIQFADQQGINLKLHKTVEQINNELMEQQRIEDPEKFSKR